MATRRLTNLALFICDLQTKFAPAIYEWPKVIATTQKMLKASSILRIPIVSTTQNAARLGPLVPELAIPHTYAPLVHVDKTRFSMCVPEVMQSLDGLSAAPGAAGQKKPAIAILGIESHICVLQTSLDLLRRGFEVYVIADGVSSCNKEERKLAFERLRQEGVRVTTSESFLYEIMGDAGISEFREIAKLVKETKESTRAGVEALCKI